MWFNKKKEKTELENIQETSIEKLIERVDQSFARSYKWTFEETIAVLEKCETTMHYLKIYQSAQHTFLQPYRDSPCVVTQETLDLLHREVSKKLVPYLKTMRPSQVGEMEKIYEALGSGWLNRDNSPGRKLLQRQVEVFWKKLAREEFQRIVTHPNGGVISLEQLFKDCKQDDPITLEIAERLNDFG